MKKNLFLFTMFVLIFTFAGCGGAVDSVKNEDMLKDKASSYKSSMLPYDQLVPAERIVILQNVFNSDTREGFYTNETRPQAVEIEYNGAKVNAWPLLHAIEFLHKGCAGTVVVVGTDGGVTEFSADDFRGMYAIFDFRSDAAPVLYNPATKSAVLDFAYAKTDEGEVIYSVVSGSYQNVNELFVKMEWDAGATYRFVATDKFYIQVDPDSAANGELRGGLSGVVNGSFSDLAMAHGKINDVLYIEPVVE